MNTEKTSRREILERAIEIVTKDRNQQYGEPEDNFGIIADLWTTYLRDRVYLSPGDIAVMMCLFKIARIITCKKQSADSYVDLAGYAACAGEIATTTHAAYLQHDNTLTEENVNGKSSSKRNNRKDRSDQLLPDGD